MARLGSSWVDAVAAASAVTQIFSTTRGIKRETTGEGGEVPIGSGQPSGYSQPLAFPIFAYSFPT